MLKPNRIILWLGLSLLSACNPPPAAVLPVASNTVTATPDLRPVEPVAAQVPVVPKEPSREGWNDSQIQWLSFDTAIGRARTEHKPVLLVFHADWCGHCHTYSHVFEDPRIVDRAKKLLMVRVDVDAFPAVASRYAPDGEYVPRTFFLNAEGSPMTELTTGRPNYRYFYDEHDPAPLLAAMDGALNRR